VDAELTELEAALTQGLRVDLAPEDGILAFERHQLLAIRFHRVSRRSDRRSWERARDGACSLANTSPGETSTLNFFGRSGGCLCSKTMRQERVSLSRTGSQTRTGRWSCLSRAVSSSILSRCGATMRHP